mgnify:CR=1 FL=1
MGTNTRDTNFGISTLGTASNLGDLIDGTDSIHTGILKALNQQTAGSFVAHGLNVTQNGSTFAVSSGGWFDKGEYKTGTPTAVNDNLNSSGAKDHYAFLVIPKDSSALALRVHASAGSTSVKVATLTAGDIPVCLIKVTAGSSAGARAIQFYGIKKLDSEFESVSLSLKVPIYKMFFRVTLPVCLPTVFDIFIYLFCNAMTTVSGVIFLYSYDTTLASVSSIHLDEQGDVAGAAAMAMLIVYISFLVRGIHTIVSTFLMKRTQAWRNI